MLANFWSSTADTLWLCWIFGASVLHRAAQGYTTSMPHQTLIKTWIWHLRAISFDKSKEGGSLPSSFEFHLNIAKNVKPCKIQTKVMKSCVYRLNCIGGCVEEAGLSDGIIRWSGLIRGDYRIGGRESSLSRRSRVIDGRERRFES